MRVLYCFPKKLVCKHNWNGLCKQSAPSSFYLLSDICSITYSDWLYTKHSICLWHFSVHKTAYKVFICTFALELLVLLLIISQCVWRLFCPRVAECSFSEMENNVLQDEDWAAETDHLQRKWWNDKMWVMPVLFWCGKLCALQWKINWCEFES